MGYYGVRRVYRAGRVYRALLDWGLVIKFVLHIGIGSVRLRGFGVFSGRFRVSGVLEFQGLQLGLWGQIGLGILGP